MPRSPARRSACATRASAGARTHARRDSPPSIATPAAASSASIHVGGGSFSRSASSIASEVDARAGHGLRRRGDAREPLLGPGTPRRLPPRRERASPAPPRASRRRRGGPSRRRRAPRRRARWPRGASSRGLATGCRGRAPRPPRARGRRPPPSRTGRPQRRRPRPPPCRWRPRARSRPRRRRPTTSAATDAARREPHAKSRLRKTSALSDEQRRRVAERVDGRARPRRATPAVRRRCPSRNARGGDVDVEVGDDARERLPAVADGGAELARRDVRHRVARAADDEQHRGERRREEGRRERGEERGDGGDDADLADRQDRGCDDELPLVRRRRREQPRDAGERDRPGNDDEDARVPRPQERDAQDAEHEQPPRRLPSTPAARSRARAA